MASIRKSFSLRNGVQVDDDNLIVNANGLVGIGTSVPTELLDVRGTAKIVGLVTATSVFTQGITVTGVSTLSRLNIGVTSISTGVITATSGVVTYYGDGGKLLNLPTSQWLDVDVGLGFTSIYAQGNVGVSTNDPRFVFQIGGNQSTSLVGFSSGVGFNSTGNVLATGIVTASSFVGDGSSLTSLNASNISSGTLNNSRLPSNISVSGIVTANTFHAVNYNGTSTSTATFTGSFVGIASTARDITSTSNITVNSINAGFSTAGIATVYTRLLLPANQPLGIGTTNPSGDVSIRRAGITSIVMVTDGSFRSSIIFGRSISGVGSNAELRFGNTNGTYPDSTEKSLDIINYDTGNFNYYLHNGPVGISTGSFNWIYGQDLSSLMTLTYTGRLGINQQNPTNNLHVVGTSTVTQSAFFGGSIEALGNINTPGILTASNRVITGITSVSDLRVRTTSSTYPLQVGTNPDLTGGGVGIDSTGKIITQGDYTGRNLTLSGIITATGSINSSAALTGTSLNVSGGAISGGTITGTSLNVSSGAITGGTITGSSIIVGSISNLTTAIDQSSITGSAFYPPILTTTQRNALTVGNGAIIYNSSNNRLEVYVLGGWVGISTIA